MVVEPALNGGAAITTGIVRCEILSAFSCTVMSDFGYYQEIVPTDIGWRDFQYSCDSITVSTRQACLSSRGHRNRRTSLDRNSRSSRR